jgi:hypothetical protein
VGKSLEMSSGGLDFEEFMRKLVNAPVSAKKPNRARRTTQKGTPILEKKRI